MKFLLALLLLFPFFIAKSQVKLLSYSDLEARLVKGADTTYVINFWATWCSPCIEELPRFEKLQLDFNHKPLKVILISLDFKSKLKNVVIPFVEKNELKSEIYVINEIDQRYFVNKVDKNWSGAIPATLFINIKKNVRSFYQNPFTTYKQLTDQLAILKLTP